MPFAWSFVQERQLSMQPQIPSPQPKQSAHLAHDRHGLHNILQVRLGQRATQAIASAQQFVPLPPHLHLHDCSFSDEDEDSSLACAAAALLLCYDAAVIGCFCCCSLLALESAASFSFFLSCLIFFLLFISRFSFSFFNTSRWRSYSANFSYSLESTFYFNFSSFLIYYAFI